MADKIVDPLEGIEREGTRVVMAGSDHPDHAIMKGDRLIVRETDTAPDGVLVVSAVGDAYTLCSSGGGVQVHAVVVGVVRRVGDA